MNPKQEKSIWSNTHRIWPRPGFSARELKGWIIMIKRKPFNSEAYVETIQSSPCFICQLVADNSVNPHHIIYENKDTIVFLNKYPVLYGYSLVAPKTHKEQVTGDFSREEYLKLQEIIYAVAEATRRHVQPERVYILSLGSQQGNRHVHWHIAPLPPGLPFDEQQLNALRFGNGVLDMSEEERQKLATALRNELNILGFV
jgi:diadenosine tetraphosphate (Ap4A) HIT family hydrolase